VVRLVVAAAAGAAADAAYGQRGQQQQ